MIDQVLNATLPIYIILFTGFIASWFNLLNQKAAGILTSIIYYIVLPVTLFLDIAKIPLSKSLNGPYIAAYFVAAIILISSTILVSKVIFKRDHAETLINAMASNHTNTAYLALPIFLLLFHTAVPVAGIIILQSVFTFCYIVGLEITTKGTKADVNWLLFINIFITNPILIGIILGIIASGLSFKIPTLINNTFTLISQSASFLALLALGISLANKDIKIGKHEKYEISYLIILKSLLHPILGFVIGKYIFHLDSYWLRSLVLMCAMPNAKNLYIFSRKYNIGLGRTNIIVLTTTLFSLISINIVLWMFS